jgi:Tol biopolymer transport system component
MPLAPGSRLGAFEIVAPIGSGGMGEVYRARDPRLGRDVAVKVLPSDAATDPGLVARFEQEARAASALNHPNIVTVHAIGQESSTLYIAMELVEGKTLRELLQSGRLASRKVVEIALQVAQGLARAHSAGIVHRDLKPENIMVSRDGLVKILDFGLAKLIVRENDGPAADDGTIPNRTLPGFVMGTAGYMSPEQVRGGAVDSRSDIFSFGSILYEMVSGSRAFSGDSTIETMNAILKEDPPDLDLSDLRLPAGLDRVIRHCLEKDPDQRFQSAKDLAFDLDAMSRFSTASARPGELAPLRRPKYLRPRMSWLAGALALLCGVLLVERIRRPGPPSFRQVTFRHGTIPSARFAPEGRAILCGAAWDGGPLEIFTVRPESPESRPLGVKGAGLLAISPFGDVAISLGRRFVGGFLYTGTLGSVPLAGGAPREILEDVEEADWGPDGRELAVVRTVGGRDRLEFPIGQVIYETSGYISHIRVSPAGGRIAFIDHAVRLDNAGSVCVIDRDGRRQELSSGWSSAEGLAWAPKGREIWFTATRVGASRALFAVTPAGHQRLVWRVPGRLTLQDISPEGRVLLTHDSRGKGIIGLTPELSKGRDLSWFDWSRSMDLSPDGRLVLFDETGEGGGEEYSVYLRGTDGSPAVRLGDGIAQALSPDGRWALCIITHSSPQQLKILPTGPGQPRIVTHDRINHVSASWLPDGRRIVFVGNSPGAGPRLYVQDLEEGPARPISAEGVSIFGNSVRPDGRFVAAAGPGRRIALYPLEGGTPRPLPGVLEGESPVRWSPDGRSLFVWRPGELPAMVTRVEIATGRRTPVREILPADPAGVLSISPVLLSEDGKTCVYTYFRILSDLYVVEGLR